jgi:lysozyme family protein
VEEMITPTIERLINHIIDVEGEYVYHENDKGGPTRWGITEAVARANGYNGAMKALPREFAFEVIANKYYFKPHFSMIAEISPRIAEELTDTGVNMGPARASMFLQRCLNAFNRQGKDYADIAVDGAIGRNTVKTLKAYLDKRGKEGGEEVLLTALNCLQGEKYIAIAEHDHKQEDFLFGWLKNRVYLSRG